MEPTAFEVQLRINGTLAFTGQRDLTDILRALEILENSLPTVPTPPVPSTQPLAEAPAPPDIIIHNDKFRIALTRDQANDLITLIDDGRDFAENSNKWTTANLDMWDSIWTGPDGDRGIRMTLIQMREPRLTLKQLLWCTNSITKTRQVVPAWMTQCIQDLRECERRGYV